MALNQDVYWYKIDIDPQLKSTLSKKLFLVIDNAIIDNIDIFLYNQQHKTIKHKTLSKGHLMNANAGYRGRSIGFIAKNNELLSFYIRVQTGKPKALPISIMTEDVFEGYNKLLYLFWGICISILLTLVLYVFILLMSMPSAEHFWVFFYYLSSFITSAAMFGFGLLLWPDPVQDWLSSVAYIIVYFVSFSAHEYFIRFLKPQVHVPRFSFFINAYRLFIIMCFVHALNHPINEHYHIFQASLFYLTVQLIYMSLLGIKHGYADSKWVLFAWFLTIMGAICASLAYQGRIPANFLTLNGYLVGTLFELFIIAYLLYKRILAIEKAALVEALTDTASQLPNYAFFTRKFAASLKEVNGNISDRVAFIIVENHSINHFIGVFSLAKMYDIKQAYLEKMQAMVDKLDYAIGFDTPTAKRKKLLLLADDQVLMLVNIKQQPIDKIAVDCAEQLNQLANQLPNYPRCNYKVGAAIFERDIDKDECYRRAQIALRQCDSDRVLWNIHTHKQDEVFREQQYLLTELKVAIVDKNIDIYLQPQFTLDGQTMVGVEVLARWDHPVLGRVSPAQFIAIAEKADMVFDLTQLIVEKAFAWLTSNTAILSSTLSSDFHLAINFSIKDIQHHQFSEFLTHQLAMCSFSPKVIAVEVTESLAIDTPDVFWQAIDTVRQLGIALHVDDFGSGCASMDYIKSFKADIIKIDMQFIRNIHLDTVNCHIVAAIVSISKAVGAKTIAEGVEQEAERSVLVDLGVDYVQGYLFSPPLSVQAFNQQYIQPLT